MVMVTGVFVPKTSCSQERKTNFDHFVPWMIRSLVVSFLRGFVPMLAQYMQTKRCDMCVEFGMIYKKIRNGASWLKHRRPIRAFNFCPHMLKRKFLIISGAGCCHQLVALKFTSGQ